ncbi:hypothetical protein [Bradyrhizobium sp. 15]|uniref:hypothetical protein n=1 Tax=Bradyrhizobium sp. 15 TaxID=2782633 RepID=UPI003207FD8A
MQFAAALPALRDRITSAVKRDGLSREKTLATIGSEKILIWLGHAEYVAKNKPYGHTTMHRKHVAIGRGALRFERGRVRRRRNITRRSHPRHPSRPRSPAPSSAVNSLSGGAFSRLQGRGFPVACPQA